MLRYYIQKMIDERAQVLRRLKMELEEQITQDTAKEIDLQEAYLEQRRQKLADTIIELKTLEPYVTTPELH